MSSQKSTVMQSMVADRVVVDQVVDPAVSPNGQPAEQGVPALREMLIVAHGKYDKGVLKCAEHVIFCNTKDYVRWTQSRQYLATIDGVITIEHPDVPAGHIAYYSRERTEHAKLCEVEVKLAHIDYKRTVPKVTIYYSKNAHSSFSYLFESMRATAISPHVPTRFDVGIPPKLIHVWCDWHGESGRTLTALTAIHAYSGDFPVGDLFVTQDDDLTKYGYM